MVAIQTVYWIYLFKGTSTITTTVVIILKLCRRDVLSQGNVKCKIPAAINKASSFLCNTISNESEFTALCHVIDF